jgi:hypothetical protein
MEDETVENVWTPVPNQNGKHAGTEIKFGKQMALAYSG